MTVTCSVDGCDKTPGRKTGGLCSMHYARKARHGDPNIVLRVVRPHGSVQEILRSAAASATDECIILPKSAGGYLSTSIDGKPMIAARAVWTLAYGDPGEAHVLHSCNYGSGAHGCINPRHLRLGTPGDNIADQHTDPRVVRHLPIGEANHNARLTVAAIVEIRASDETDTALARKFGVARSTIRFARDRRTWRHVP